MKKMKKAISRNWLPTTGSSAKDGLSAMANHYYYFFREFVKRYFHFTRNLEQQDSRLIYEDTYKRKGEDALRIIAYEILYTRVKKDSLKSRIIRAAAAVKTVINAPKLALIAVVTQLSAAGSFIRKHVMMFIERQRFYDIHFNKLITVLHIGNAKKYQIIPRQAS